MSKTKTKRMVASFLLLCAMSGGAAFAKPDGWTIGDSLGQYKDGDNNVIFDETTDFSDYKPGGSTQGALYVDYETAKSPINVILQGSDKTFTFEDNLSQDSGSAIWLTGKDTSLTIEGQSVFRNNSVGSGYGPYNGGAIYNEGSTIVFKNAASFVNNRAIAADGRGRGGAIASLGNITFEKGAVFSGNKAATDGGAIVVDAGGVLSVSGGAVEFKDNIAGSRGGAIYSEGQISLNSNGGAITFDGNKANNQNNDVYLAAGSLMLQGSNAITFNGSILGEAATSISNEAANLVLNGDNSDYQGTFTQASGKTTVKGKFFGGSNIHQINGGELVLAAANAIDGSKIALSGTDTTISINNDTNLTGNVTGTGKIVLDSNADLTLTGDNSLFSGTYEQVNGTLTIGDGINDSKSFSGTNNINGGTVTVNNKAVLLGTNSVNGGNVTLENGSTLAGTNKITSGIIDIFTKNTTGSQNTILGGTVNVKTGGILGGTNTITGGSVNVQGALNGANTTLSDAGKIVLTSNAVLDGLKEMTGGTLTATGATFKGTSNISGGNVTIAGGSSISEGASLNITGGNVNINQNLNLTNGNITGNNSSATITMNGSSLGISGDQSGFDGNFNMTGGTINIGQAVDASVDAADVTGGKFFGGNSNLTDTTVNIYDKGQIIVEDGKKLNLDNTTINISNNGLSENVDQYGVPTSNGKESTISGTVVGDSDSFIIVDGENTYLVVNGDMSGYIGDFIQNNGTTEVTGGTFFGGNNDIMDGNFIFRDGAKLSSDVEIIGEDVKLTIGNGDKGYTITDGNKVAVDGGSFVLTNVRMTETIFDNGSVDSPISINDSNLKLAEKAGFAGTAHYELGGEQGKIAHITMEDGSVAADGSTLTINKGSDLTIDADTMYELGHDGSEYTYTSGGKFEMDLIGDGNIYVNRKSDTTDADYSETLVFTSDNSGFVGQYLQSNRDIKFYGGKFFNGQNLITQNSSVDFDNRAEILGQNQIDAGSSFNINDAIIGKTGTTKIVLNGGDLNINDTDFDLNIGIKNTIEGGNINKKADGSLTILANQHNYTGNYNQTGSGTTTVNAGNSFFGGKNTISAGIVDVTAGDSVDNAVMLAGQNIIDGTGTIRIGDFTNTDNLKDNKITINSDAATLELFSEEGNNKNTDVTFAIEGQGLVLHSGEGSLNLINVGENDLFENFNGTFKQENTSLGADKKLITNVFGKFFKNSEIKNGTLNLKDGAELVEGSTTKIAAGANLNIGTIADDTTVNPEKFDNNSKVTISGSIEGNGAVNISQGTTTIKGTSNNSAFEGSYHQTGGTVVAEKDSTFFGGVIKNLIEHGKLLFKQDAKLAEGKDVELSGNQYLSAGDLKTPVLDLDGRDNAKFVGGNTLYIGDKTTEGFVFTNGILENAILHGVQDIVGNGNGVDDKDAVITLRTGSGLASDAVVSVSNGAELVFGTGSVAEKGSEIDIKEDGELILVSQNLDWHTIVTGDGSIAVMKDDRETGSPNINIYGDQSGFKGNFVQAAGRVTVKSGSTFFGGTNEITGFIDVDDNDPNKIIKETSGDLYLEKGSLLGSDITVTNFDKTANAGVSTPHGRVFVEDKIFTQDGVELVDIDELINQNNLYYNNILKADGTIDVDSLKQININNGGLILSNGTIFETPNGTAIFERKENGIIDIGFSNNTGVNGDILLKRDTMLSYGDNAFIKDDSTLTMEDTAILNFINDNAVVNYNPTIVGGGSIYKEGLAATNISSAIDMTGEVNVKEGTLNFTNKDKVIFKKGDDLRLRQTGNLTVGSNSASANLSIIANQTQFDGNVIANAQDGTQSGLYLLGKNTNIGGNLDVNNTITSIAGNTTIGGNWNIDGNSSLNLIGNYANTIDVAGDLILGENLKDGKLPIAFDYDPHRNKMDTIIVDSFINDKNSPLLITGINFVTSPADRTFSLDADRLIQQRNPQDQPYYDPTAFYANTAMGRYYLTNGSAGGPNLTGSLVYLNPQQYRGQVATIASWQNQLVVNNMLFDHMDVITRQLMDDQKTANKYASAQPQFAPYQYDLKGGSLWYKAYGNFERLSMTRGLSVGNNAYGSLIGADFPLIKLKNGWNLVPTAYIGYNGAHQHFRGVSMYQNGAQLGLMGTAYKGNFITSLLAYGGGYGNDMSMSGEFGSGSDNTGNWFAGVASKTAYNIHLPADFIFQPTLMAAYNAFGSQNWGSDFGVLSMSSGMLNGINVAPGFNLIWQKKTFNIYATAQMVYNIMGGVDGRAGNIDLGYVRMRHSYFEYGLGVSKTFKDRFNGFIQFTIRNGGRTGIGFTGGLQIKVGK